MAISYPRAFPTHDGIAGIHIEAQKAQGASFSPYNWVPKVYEHPGERWSLEISLPAMKRATAAPWIAWLASLNGMVGSFNCGDPSAATPQGTASGTWQCTGAIRAKTVTLVGSGTLKAGDYVTIQNRYLHMIVQDGVGGGAFEIWPGLRIPCVGTTTQVTSPYGRWMLMDMPSWAVGLADIHQPATIKAVEDLRE